MEDKRVIEFSKRIEVRYEPELGKIDLPNGKIIWRLPTFTENHARGRGFRAFTEYTKGDPWTEETYFTDTDLKRKFLAFASLILSGSEKWCKQMNSIIDMLLSPSGIGRKTLAFRRRL
jgi:hypothetical protein